MSEPSEEKLDAAVKKAAEKQDKSVNKEKEFKLEEKKSSGNGKFFLGAAIGAIAGAVAGHFISKNMQEAEEEEAKEEAALKDAAEKIEKETEKSSKSKK